MSTTAGEDMTDIGPRIDGISWALTATASVLLGTRLYVRVTQSRLWWDDYFLLFSVLLLIVHVSLSSYAVTLGFGKHTAIVPVENLYTLVKLVSVTSALTLIAAAFSKTSFALTLLRLTDGWLKRAVWAIIITLNLTLFINAILPFTRCTPSEASWNPAVEGTCFDILITIRFSIFGAAYSAAMDWLLALVPWAIIMNLNMRRNEKVGVAICMSLGFVAGITSIVRCVKIPLVNTTDFTYRAGDLAIWTVAEVATTVMASSIPVLRVFLRKIVTSHPGSHGAVNPYHRSAADGTFVKNLHPDSKDTQHTTNITSDVRSRNSGDVCRVTRFSRDRYAIAAAPSPQDDGIIMKTETVAVHFDQRQSHESENGGSTLVGDESNAKGSIELQDVSKLRNGRTTE
ncbi:hypothetical protein BJ166DRAFT_197689 [Pestalotiopsis sp. NC0098]|nr:hypothetical protein BJ166DRAFT_197689 [Pestalotiopsis sp. NC0098]